MSLSPTDSLTPSYSVPSKPKDMLNVTVRPFILDIVNTELMLPTLDTLHSIG